jgi:hypothetical protein
MAKNNKEMEYFRAGMERAYRILKDDGPEALEKEMKFRNITQVNSRLSFREIDSGIAEIKMLTFETILAMSMGVLYSEFGFGKKRLERFRDVFMEATENLNDGVVTWADICYNIEDLTGVRMTLVDELGRDTGMIREV